jgi:hypothetical protein
MKLREREEWTLDSTPKIRNNPAFYLLMALSPMTLFHVSLNNLGHSPDSGVHHEYSAVLIED